MKTLFSLVKKTNNEDGFVLITSLLMLVVLMIIGVAATSTTTIELQISGNEKTNEMAFYLADGGAYTTAKLIGETVDAGEQVDYSANDLTYEEADEDSPGDFYRKIMGFIDPDSTKDATLQIDSDHVDIAVIERNARNVVGGGVEFSSGTSGAGVGSRGGASVLFTTQTTGVAPTNSQATVEVVYRKIAGVGGGL